MQNNSLLEERAAELVIKNQQLTEFHTEFQVRDAQRNQQFTESLAITEEMTKLVLECEQLKQHSSDFEVKSLKGELQKSKGRVCERISEFDFATWEKDCELESCRKQ